MGFQAADVEKLKSAGIHNIESLAHTPRRELEGIKGLGTAKIEKMQKEGRMQA
jgi:predicted RecB family nuclease